LRARAASILGNIELMRSEMDSAIQTEDNLGPPPARLPFPIQPSHELFAELLWKHKQGRIEIIKHLDLVSSMQPNRWRTSELRKYVGD
jgi:hypothetical protein